jgi:hypothetical protein
MFIPYRISLVNIPAPDRHGAAAVRIAQNRSHRAAPDDGWPRGSTAYIMQRAPHGDRTVSDSPSEPTIDLGYIGQALQRLTTEVASLRNDMHVLARVVQRLDNSQGRMLEELTGMHRQYLA